jgi:two-component system response regulator LytT
MPMKLCAVVVDDEQPARDELCYLLGRIAGVTVVGQAADGVEAVRVVRERQPEAVFLDIAMPGLTGFEVARRLLADRVAPEFVFVTAYDHYAVNAFEVNAVDYLLKPVDPRRLEEAVQRVRRRLSAEPRAALDEATLQRVAALVAAQDSRRDRLALKVGERFLLVNAEDIIYATVADDAVKVVVGGVTGTSSCRTLDELQAMLDPRTFWRVHRSYLVNINKVKEIVPWFSRNYLLKMKDPQATEIPVSRAQTRRLREYLRL